MMGSKIPCKKCPVLAICRNRTFEQFISSCSLVRDYLHAETSFQHKRKLRKLNRHVKSNIWKFITNGIRGFEIIYQQRDKSKYFVRTP